MASHRPAAFNVAVILFEIHLPYCQSLKAKRMQLRSIKARLAKRLNVAVAEVGCQEQWQRAQVACVSVSNDRQILEKLRDQVELIVLDNLDGELIYCDLDWL